MNLPLELSNKTVLVAGCGGGYDVVCALPVALQLEAQGNRVYLASASFTNLDKLTGTRKPQPLVTLVSPESSGEGYCPEVHLSRWLASRPGAKPALGISPEIFCWARIGVLELRDVFVHLQLELGLDALVVVDGGVDGLFRGDEHDLGSPTIDAVSMIAGTLCTIPEKHYVVTAFGTEGVNKEVSHAEALARIADVTRLGGLHGVCALVKKDPVTQQFEAALSAMYARTEAIHHSNMVGSIRASYQGEFGDVAVTTRTVLHPVWVSPLTSLYWFLDLGRTSRLKLYFEALSRTRTYAEALVVTQHLEQESPAKRRQDKPAIPI